MFRKSLSLLPVAAAFVLGSSARSNAQSYHAVSQLGSVNGSFAVSVSANSYNSDPTQPTYINGKILLTGYAGSLALNLGAPVNAMTLDTIKVAGGTYKRTTLTSGTFVYVDLNTKTRTIAKMQASIVNYQAGTLTFQIVDVLTGVTLAATATPDGQLLPLQLTSGSTYIF